MVRLVLWKAMLPVGHGHVAGDRDAEGRRQRAGRFE
jgi:hypothetical protein